MVTIDETTQKEIKEKTRNTKTELKAKKEKIVAEMLGGQYIYTGKDKTVKELENRFRFLDTYMELSDLKKQSELLTKESEFKIFESKINYWLVGQAIQKDERVSDENFLFYTKLKKLESKVKPNTIITSKELKTIAEDCKFLKGNRDYLRNSLGLIFEYEMTKDQRHFQIKRKINHSSLITKRKVMIPTELF